MDKSNGQSYGSGVNTGKNKKVTSTDRKLNDNNRQASNVEKFEKYMPRDGKGAKFLNSNSKFNEIRSAMEASQKAGKDKLPVAHFSAPRISDISATFENTILYSGGGSKPKAAKNIEKAINAHIGIYSNLRDKNFFADVMNLSTLSKTNTPTNLMKQVVALNQNNNIMTNMIGSKSNLLNFDDMYKNVLAMDNILQNGGHIISFDLETLSGINEYGHTVLNNITELSATVFALDGKNATKALTVDSVLGFTKTEYDEVEQVINKLASAPKNKWSNEEKVLYDRLNIYGHTKTVQNGFEVNVTESKAIEDISTSINNARKGAKKLFQIAEDQKSWMRDQGMEISDASYAAQRTSYIKDYVELLRTGKYQDKTFNNIMPVGHNIANFDIPNLEIASGTKLSDMRYVDTLQMADHVANVKGGQAVFAPGSHRVKGKGPATQEQLASAHGIKIPGTAHVGRIDQEEDARFFLQEIGDANRAANEVASGSIPISNNSIYGHWRKQLDEVKAVRDKTSSLYTGNNQIFYMDHTMQKSFFDNEGSISFQYNPVNGKIKTFDGFEIGLEKNGAIEDMGYNAFGPRADALYTHSMYKINPNEDFAKQFMDATGVDKRQANKLFQRVSSSKELYIIESQQYFDMATLERELGSKEAAEYFYNNRVKTYTIETNPGKLGNIGVHVATQGKDGITPNAKNINGLGFKMAMATDNGVVLKENKYAPEHILNFMQKKNIDRTINDPAARKIRDLDYKRVMQIRNYQKTLQTNGSNSTAPITTRIAELISQNKTINLADHEEIIKHLGWNDLKTGKSKIVTETINNAMIMDSYISQMSPLVDTVEEVLNDVYGKLDISTPEKLANVLKDPASRELLEKKNLGFQHLWNNVLDTISNSATIKNNYVDTLLSEKDLNKIDFNTFDLFPEKYINTVDGRGIASEITTIDLNKRTSLLDVFYKGKFNDVDDLVSKDMNAGFDSLRTAYDAFRSDKRFVRDGQRIFDGIDAFNPGNRTAWNYNVSELLDQMTSDLRTWTSKERENNPAFGLLHGRLNQSALTAGAIGNYSRNLEKEQLQTLVRSGVSTLPKDFKLLTNNSDQAINDLIHDYFLTFSMNDLNISGLNSEQANFMKKQYEVAERVAKSHATDLIESIKGTDLRLGITTMKDKNIVSLFDGNQVTHLNNLFSFNHLDGVMTYKVGDNDYALRLGLGRQLKNGKSDVFDISNNVEKITSRNLFRNNVNWATKAGDSPVDGILKNIKSTSRYLMNSSARIEGTNGQLFAQSFAFDINETLFALPDLLASDKFNFSKMEDDFNIPKEARQYIRGLADKIKKDPKKYRDETFKKVLPIDLNYFTNNYMMPIVDRLKNDDSMFNGSARTILKGIGADTKNTQLQKGYASGVSSYYMDPLAGIVDNTSRPPVTQMGNSRLYDKKELSTSLSKLQKFDERYKNLTMDSVYTGTNAERWLYNNNGKTTGLTMRYMQVDSYSLSGVFLDKSNQTSMNSFIERNYRDNDAKRAKEVIRDRAKRLSTYEQQSNMDARVHDATFYKTNTQTINAKKRMVNDHKRNLAVIEEVDSSFNKLHFEIKNGEIVYEIGNEVKAGQSLGRFGNTDFNQIITAKRDGMFRGRYFDSTNEVVSEKELNKLIQSSGIDKTNNEEILGLLDRHFNFKYEVLGLEEDHGSKIFLGASEKTTVDSMKLAIGEIDTDLAKQLKAKGMGDIVGKVVRKQYLDEVVVEQLKQKFGDDWEGIHERILKERYSFSDAVREIDAFKNVSVITNLDVGKHNSGTAVMHTFLNQLRDKGMMNTENMDQIFGQGMYTLRNNQVLIHDNLKKVNLDFEKDSALYNILYDTEKELSVEHGGKKIGNIGIGHFVQVLDDSAGTYAGLSDEVNAIGEKGIKFSDHMGSNLDRMRYNEDSMGLVYQHYLNNGNVDEFKRVYGHAADIVDGELVLNEKYLGKSYAEGITAKLRKQLIKSDNDITLEHVYNDKKMYGQYKHIVDSVRETSGRLGDITLNNAENMYSYYRGAEAIKINAAMGDSADALVEKAVMAADYKKFNVLDFSVDNPDWLDLQTGKQGRTVTNATNNPYTNNLIIKTGLGGKHENIAIARMPETHAGDMLVTPKHISGLQGIQDIFMTYKNSDGADRTKAETDLRGAIDRFKKQQIADISGKEGLGRKITEYRMDQSFMGKGSGIVMRAFDETGTNLFGSHDVESLNRVNANIFSKAEFMGKTLNQHYADGAVIDSVFANSKVFESMGYFKEDYMSKTIANLKGDIATEVSGMGDREAMEHLLSRYGDAVVGVRYPEIMQGSDKFNMMYLDNTLKSNELRVLGPTGMSAKLDFDGDSYNVARIKTSSGQSYLNSIVGKVSDDELTGLTNGIQTSINTRAVTDNKYWEVKVQDFMTGKKGLEQNAGEATTRIQDVLSKNFIGNVAYKAEDLTDRELFGHYKTFEDVLKTEYKSDSLLKKAILDVDNSDDAMQHFANAKYYSDRNNMITAKIYQNAVGEANVTNQKVKKVIHGLLDPTASDYEYKSNLMYDFLYQAEEAAISAKSSIKGLTESRSKIWNDAVSGVIKGAGDKRENLKVMKDWLNENISDELTVGLYYNKSSHFQDKVFSMFNVNSLGELDKAQTSKLKGSIIDDIITTIDNVGGNADVANVYDSLRVATSEAGVDYRRVQDMFFIKGQESNLKTVFEGMGEIFEENVATIFDNTKTDFTGGRQFLNSIDETISAAEDAYGNTSTKGKIEGIIGGVEEIAKSVKGKKLAMGAVGIAAGIMMAGFVGGRPRPADVHAMEEATDYPKQEGYQLADPNLATGQGGQGGYVININARTDKGRDNAVQALQQAIQSGTSSTINVAMNITNDYGNINDRAIEEAITRAF